MSQQWKSKSIPTSPHTMKSVYKKQKDDIRNKYEQKKHYSFWWFLVAIFLIGFLYLIFIVLPRVDIILIPDVRTVEIETEFTFSKSVDKLDINEKIIPIRSFRIPGEVSGSFLATGEKNVGDIASGDVIFYNYTGTIEEVVVGDPLENIDGISYVLQSDIQIPGAVVSRKGEVVPGKLTSQLVALEAGESGNITPQRIYLTYLSHERQGKIYGELSKSTSGGTSEVIRVASQSDLDKARKSLEEDLINKLSDEVDEKIDSGLAKMDKNIILEEDRFVAEVNLDEELEEFISTLEASGEFYIYKEEDLDKLVKNLVLEQLSPEEQLVNENPSSVLFEVIPSENEQIFIMKAKVSWKAGRRINLQELKSSILGLNEPEARRKLLTNPSISDVRFRWITALSHKIPRVPTHINISLSSK